NEVLEVDEGGGDQAGQEDGIDEREPGGLVPECQPAAQEGYGGQQLEEKVADGNGRAAVPAFPVQIQPGGQRDVQIPGDGELAVRTVGGRGDDALPQRQAVDADVEEAPNHGAEDEKHHGPEVEWHGRPVT